MLMHLIAKIHNFCPFENEDLPVVYIEVEKIITESIWRITKSQISVCNTQ